MKNILFLFIAIATMCISCEKEPEVIVKTVTETVTVTIIDTIRLTDTITQIQTVIENITDTATTFILVRHAEKGGGNDPDLNANGKKRAMELSRILENVPLDAIYSTDYNRTRQTAVPIAKSKTLNIIDYNPSNLDAFVDSSIEEYHGGVILAVGHSNTTPDLVNILLGSNTYSTFPESEYDNIFVVTVFEKGRAKVIHIKYGE